MRQLSTKEMRVLIDNVKKAIDTGAHPVAAFDADGTLWDTDLGENFFKHQIKERLVELPPNPWEHYQDWHEKDPIPAYLWLAQINAGKPINEVLNWAKTAIGNYPKVPVFGHMVELIHQLKKLNVDVYIVTASVKWAIQPAAELVGVDFDKVIGIRTRIDANGIVTNEPEGAVTWREGKVHGIHEVTGGKAPVFAAGNSTGDLFLLDAASHVALANTLAAPHESYYPSEQELLREAIKRGWYRIIGQ